MEKTRKIIFVTAVILVLLAVAAGITLVDLKTNDKIERVPSG